MESLIIAVITFIHLLFVMSCVSVFSEKLLPKIVQTKGILFTNSSFEMISTKFSLFVKRASFDFKSDWDMILIISLQMLLLSMLVGASLLKDVIERFDLTYLLIFSLLGFLIMIRCQRKPQGPTLFFRKFDFLYSFFILANIFFGFALWNQDNKFHFNEGHAFFVFRSPLLFLNFFVLLFLSPLFILKTARGEKFGTTAISANVSKVLWFTLLAHFFLGLEGSSHFIDFFEKVIATSVLIFVYDLFEFYLSKIRSDVHYEKFLKLLIPVQFLIFIGVYWRS